MTSRAVRSVANETTVSMMAVAMLAVIVTMTMTVARAETVTMMMTHRPALAQVSVVLSLVHRPTPVAVVPMRQSKT